MFAGIAVVLLMNAYNREGRNTKTRVYVVYKLTNYIQDNLMKYRGSEEI